VHREHTAAWSASSSLLAGVATRALCWETLAWSPPSSRTAACREGLFVALSVRMADVVEITSGAARDVKVHACTCSWSPQTLDLAWLECNALGGSRWHVYSYHRPLSRRSDESPLRGAGSLNGTPAPFSAGDLRHDSHGFRGSLEHRQPSHGRQGQGFPPLSGGG
jgi:hypothetical protein